jgi:hypothetical protein
MLKLDAGSDGRTGIGFKVLGKHYSNLYFIDNYVNKELYDYLEEGLNNYFIDRQEVLKLVEPFNNKNTIGILITLNHDYNDDALFQSNQFKKEFEEFYTDLIKNYN